LASESHIPRRSYARHVAGLSGRIGGTSKAYGCDGPTSLRVPSVILSSARQGVRRCRPFHRLAASVSPPQTVATGAIPSRSFVPAGTFEEHQTARSDHEKE